MLILVAGTFLFFSIFAVLLPSSGVVLGEELPPVPWDRVEGDGETPKETGRLLQARSASASSRPHGTISSAFNVTDSFPPTFSGGTAVVHVEGDLEGVAPDSRTDCGPSAFRGGVWYTIRLPESRNPLAVSVDTCTNTTIDTVMGVVSGSDCPSNSSACECKWNDDACGIQSRVQLTERGGSDLFVTVGPYGALGDVTGFTLSFSLSELCEVPANTTRLDISGLDPRLVRSSNAAVTVREQTPVRVHLQCPQGDVCMYRNNEEEFWRYDGQCFIDLQCVSGLKIATAGRRPKCTAPNRADTIANATDLSDHFPLFVQEAGCATSFFGDWQNSTGDADFVDCGGSTSTGGVWHNSACRIRMVLSECTSTRTLVPRRNQSRVSFVEGQEGSRASSWVFALVRPSVSEVKDSQFNLSVTLSAAHSSNRIEDAANFGEHTLTAFPEEDLSISVTGDWEGATGDWDFRHCGGSASMPGVWHKLRLPESRGNLSVSVESRSDTQSNTAVGILSGDGCPSNRSACVCKAWDEEGDGHLSRVSFLGSGGSEAFVLVRPSENSDGEGFNLTASIAQTASRPTRLISQGARHSLTVDDQGGLFVFGDNRNGQLGLEGWGTFRLPTRVRQVSGVVDACGGGEFSLALLRNGTVLSWGENSYGQLDRGNETDWRRPGTVQGLQNEKVVGVACGRLHGAGWTEGGKIFTWGLDWNGRLGLSHTPARGRQMQRRDAPTTSFQTRTTFETITPDVCRGRSIPEGSDDGENRRTASLVNAPISEGEAVAGVSLGEAHTLIVTRSGRAFGWGWNCNGQLGNGQSGEDAEENSPVEIVVGEEERIVAVSAGGSHSLVLTASQNVFAFGRNFEGQVGVERAGRTVATPHLLENLPGRVVEIAAGENFSFLRLEDGRVLSFGENGEGQLGLGHTDSQREPRLVDGLRAARLWKGGAKTFTSLLVATGGVQGAGESSVGGKAYMGLTGSGSNEQGQLGLGSSGRLTNSELSIAPLFVTFWCPPAVSFPTDPGASSWRSSRGSFAAFFPSPFSSLSIDPEEPEEGVATGRTQVTFVPPVDSRVFDFGRSQKIRASLADQLSEQNAMMCDFPANVIDTEPPLPVCPSLLRLNVSRDARDISVLSLLEAPQVRDNVGLPAEVSLHYTFPAFPHSLPTIADLHSHFQSEDILSVLVEGTDKSGNTGSCTFVITSNRCPLNADRLSADSPCLCLPGYYSGKSQSGGLVCLQCDQNSHSRMGSLSPADCLYDSGYYRDATVPDESRCRPCIQRSNSSVGTNSPSECFCAEGSYFVPAEIRNSEGAAAVSLIDIVLHSDPFSLFTSGSCEPCPSNSTCRGQLLSDFEVSRVIRESRLAATLGHFREGRRGLGERNWTSRRHPLSPFRLLEAQSFETVQRTLRGLIAHPRPVPDGNFTLVQRWPHALIAPCPYQDTCSPGVQTDYQNDTAGTVCVSGHTGPMCNECEAGWRLNRQDLQCVECPPSEAISFLVAAMLLLAMPVAVWLFTAAVSKDNPHLAAVEHAVAMKIVLAFIGRFKMLSDLAAFALQRLREEALEHGLRERGGVMAGGVAWVAMSATRILKRLRSLPSIGSVFHLDYFFFRVFPESDLVSRNLLTLTVPATILLLLAIFGLLAVFVGFCRSRKTTRKMERTASHRRNEKDGKPNNGEEERKGRCPTVLQDAVEEEGEEGREKGERTEGVSGQTDIGAANRETLVLKRNRMRAFFFKRFVGVFRCNFDESTSCWSVLTAWFEGLVALSLAIMVIWGESLVGIPVATLRCIFLHPDMPTETGLRLHIQASQQCPRGVELLFAGAFWLSCAFAVFLPIIFLAAVTCRKRALLEATGGGGNGKSQKKSPGGWCVRSLGTRNSHRSRFSWRAATATRPPPREDSFSIQNESGERGDGAERGNSILKESKESPPQSMSSAQTDLAATHASVVTGDPRALHALFQWQLSVLLVGYKEEFYYWELVIFLRRFSLPLVLLEGESLATLYILGVHAVLFLLLQSLVRPYKTATLNRLETLSLGCWLLAVLVFQFLVNPNVALITKLTLLCVFVGVSASFIVYALSAILGGFLAGAVAALKSAYGRVVSPEDGCLPAFLIPLLQKYRVFTVLLCLLEPLAVACRQRSKVLICLDENDGRGDREKGRDSAILRRAETREAEGDSCCFVCFEKRRCCRRRSPKTCGARTDLESKDLRLSGGASMGEIVAAASPLFAQTWKGVHSEVSRIEMSLLNAMAENRRKSSALSCPSETEEALECSTLEPPPLATGFTLRAARLLNRWVGPGTSVGGSASHKLLSVHVCQLPVELCVLLKQILCCREQAEEQRRKALEPDVGRTSTKLSGREEEDEGPRAVQTDLKRNTELASTLQRNHADTPRNATVGFRNFVHSPRAEGKEVCSGFEGVADDGAASELPEEGPREDVAVYAPVLRGPVGSESDEQGINVGAERPTENGEEELEHVLQGEKGSDGVFGGSPEAFLRPQKRPLQLTDEVVSPSRDAFGVEGGIDLARPAAPPSVTAKHSASKLPVSCLPRISTAKDQESPFESDLSVVLWTEKDAIIAENRLWKGLLEVCTNLPESSSMEGFLEKDGTGQKGEERETLNRMIRLSEGFFVSSNALERGEWSGLSLQQLQEGVALLRHLQPELLLQLYFSYLASAYDRMHKKTK
uniref:HYR domain-containing protein n=1 Tax=Chromera velia CCMP2878 TaxID=1169474 RepID=A0A0G4FDY1_9ALVE|eukprot:Cvel_16417.t1-p1 / transcript=Cvel_16417.t1 / gene=Cvel_16417 / organism=Chromera_velia_CCMP2878 / gene_product=Probable E3 ubiquitin-protein ligase HERC1, putative / transcript_product=Probable E3 ubiquitin-protein ligase HERC1, putative / location=Cvel_scaffold1264:10713-22891(+) / protein_length=2656 / sequence_SO=supercontig / SO=protein_coding / is_pseudo=false